LIRDGCRYLAAAGSVTDVWLSTLLHLLQVLPSHIIHRLAIGQAYAPEHHEQVGACMLGTRQSYPVKVYMESEHH
jgi:hypothetical protein